MATDGVSRPWPYEQFLASLLEAEMFRPRRRRARMRIRAADFPARTLEDFDLSAQPG